MRHLVTASLWHHITTSPCQSVICLVLCHQASQSFDLPPATKPVSHLTCPLPLRHRISQSFALPPATKPVSHFPCSLSPNQSVICLAPYHQTSQSFDLPSTTASLHHRIIAALQHHVTMSVSHLPCPLPPSQSVICLAPCHQTSQSFDLPYTTASPHHCSTMSQHHCGTISPRHCISQSFALFPATKPVSHLPCPLPPSQSVICLAPCHQTSQSFDLPYTTASLQHRVTASLWHHITTSLHQSVICLVPCHQASQSFALPPATKPVSHLTCPLPLRHCISQSFALPPATKPVSHFPCSLSPNQSVICLAPCHQTSQSFDLPSTTASPHHRSPAAPCHHVSQSFALSPATKPVSHLPCPLPPNQSVI